MPKTRMKHWRAAAGVLLAITLLGVSPAPSPSPVVDDPQAEQIYRAVRTAWNGENYPRYATYVVHVAYTKDTGDDKKPMARHYETYEDLRRNLVYAQSFSAEEEANPATPHGTNFGILGMVLNKEQEDDPLGSFEVAVNNDYGIALSGKPITAFYNSLDAADSSNLVVIGHTGTTERTYAVRLIETLDDADGRTYHLGLTPLRFPERNRVRELWVDAKTSFVKRMLLSANFDHAPLDKVAWIIEYHMVDGAPYIAREVAQGPLDFGKAGIAKDVTVSFEDIKPLSTIPFELRIGIHGHPGVTDAH
jgi:hypothetical protein